VLAILSQPELENLHLGLGSEQWMNHEWMARAPAPAFNLDRGERARTGIVDVNVPM
jgi:hypothetical protein